MKVHHQTSKSEIIGAGTIFGWGKKSSNFSFGETKIGEKQSRQSISMHNFMQYVFFEKGIRIVQWGLGQSSRSWGIFENFCVKSKSVRLLFSFHCKLQEKLGEQDELVAPPIILLGSNYSPCSPGSHTYV